VTYRPAPITQRDGSALQNSNCRMASIAVGIDGQTGGATRSTGAEMRSRQSDQDGGTDSTDAVKAWASYGEDLAVEDGETWADAVNWLQRGYMVHLDVWAATLQGVCLSGSGGYGHTIAVAPEANGTRWLVSDPWCLPPKWAWWESSLLEQAANRWGSEAYSRAERDAEWPTGGPHLRRLILARIGRDLMTLYHPGHPAPRTLPPETGGGGRILFTRSTSVVGGGDDMRFVSSGAYGVDSGLRVNVGEGASWYYLDGSKGGTFSGDASLRVLGLPDASGGGYVVVISTGAPYPDKQARDTVVQIKTTNATYPAPLPPTGDPDEIRAARDAEWTEWLTAGSPGSDDA